MQQTDCKKNDQFTFLKFISYNRNSVHYFMICLSSAEHTQSKCHSTHQITVTIRWRTATCSI